MKRIISIVLVVFVCLALFVSCGEDEKSNGVNENKNSNNAIETNSTENSKINEQPKGNNNQHIAGNTTGNIINGGLVVQQGDWIYYSNYDDGEKLYKKRINGTEKTKLNDDVSRCINVIGDWIYYRDNKSILYKIHTNGTQHTKMTFAYNDSCLYVNVVGNWIYYINNDESENDVGIISKIHIDGTQKTELNEYNSLLINVVNDWIYYTTSNLSASGLSSSLYKIRTNGTEKIKLDDNFGGIFFIVVDNWIYYSAEDGLYKICTDGTQKTKLNDGNDTYFGIMGMNVVGDWIYFQNKNDFYNDFGYKLYKIKTDGTQKTKLSDDLITGINVVGDWIYYINIADNNRLYRIRTDGTERQIFD